MPLVRIDVIEGRSEEQLAAISDSIQRAMVECFGVPERDRFHIITEHRRGRLIYNAEYLGIARGDGMLVVQILFSAGRSAEQKSAFYARVAELVVERAGVRPEDVMIALHENARGD